MRYVVLIAALVLGQVLLTTGSAFAAEATDCWTETITEDLLRTEATVCLVVGEDGKTEVRYYSSGETAPRLKDINIGYDALGTECWWRTAYDTPWVNLGVDGTGVARVGYLPEGGTHTVLDALVRSCTSQPRETENTLESAWKLANRHIHEIPDPSFNPAVGITGLETYLEVDVPDPITDSLVSPLGTTVEVEIKVAQVVVQWGDGETDDFTETTYPHLTGYPNGIARHIYETKTCPAPGGPRCHPTLSEYEIQVDFDWFVRWRVDAGAWSTIAVPNTTTLITYDVDEIVTRSVPNP